MRNMRESLRKTRLGTGYAKDGYLAYQSQQIEQLLTNGKYEQAKRYVYELLELFPDDNMTNRQLGVILMVEKKYEEALNALKRADEEIVFLILAKLYLKLDKDDSLYQLYLKYFQKDHALGLEMNDDSYTKYCNMQLYLKSRYEEVDRHKEFGYFRRQLISYDEKEAINHIIDRHTLNMECSCFDSEIDVEKLFYQMKNRINDVKDHAFLGRDTIEMYQFFYPNCGISIKGNLSSYLKVITLINTNQIITMYPTGYLKQIDVCVLKEKEEGKRKVKIKNGLERFNSRYSKK